VIEVETREGRVDMAALAARLGSMGVASILVEGGSRVLASAFKAGIVDKVCFFYAPLILGGDDGVPFAGAAVRSGSRTPSGWSGSGRCVSGRRDDRGVCRRSPVLKGRSSKRKGLHARTGD